MNRFQITRTGTYLTVQDWGRFHYQHLGISPSGIMDQRIPEALAKVIPHHQNQFLEFAYVGPSLKVEQGAIKVSVGGQCNIFVQKNNNTQIEHAPYTSINLFEGDELTIHNTIDSVYGYIAFENGLGLEPCLQSFATDTKAQIGSINRPLQIGDQFEVSEDGSTFTELRTEHTSQEVSKDVFTGDGSSTVFNSPHVATQPENLIVYIDGVMQEPVENYTTDGSTSTITISEPPHMGARIVIMFGFSEAQT